MDAIQQQSHMFMRPPPPPSPDMADPHHPSHQQQLHHHHHQPQQHPPRPPPPQGQWFSGQFHYHAQPPQPPPPPPPPPFQQQMWGDHQHGSYPPPQPNQVPPYSAQPPQPHNPYLPPPPQPPHPYSHHPQPYPPPPNHQTWENRNQTHHQSWEQQDKIAFHNNEEDWAAKAREWAAAKSAMESQHTQPQFAPVGRPEEHNHVYHDQNQQAVDPRYTDPQQPAYPPTSHQHFPVNSANPNRPPVHHLQESTFNSGFSSYVSDGNISYTGRDGAPAAAGESNPMFPQGSTATNPTIYQQEVPSSYSSIPGREGAPDQNVQPHGPTHTPMSLAHDGRHYMQPTFSVHGRSVPVEHPHFAPNGRSAEPVMGACDRPLEFTAKFSREQDLQQQTNYSHRDPTPPIVPGITYPPVPPVPSGVQFDPSFGGPAIPGHAASMYGQIPGSTFHPMTTVSGPFGLGSGGSLHPAAAFVGDPSSDRPKKASVPNWLREEIIKKKVVMASSQEYPEGDQNDPIEDDGIDNSFTNGDHMDNKNIHSSRLSEDEDDDEDDVEAARTAAINQEIKRVLTEVLLKVTDELFDEIATKVLAEDDVTVEVDKSSNTQKHASPPPVPTIKASANVLIPLKPKENEADDLSDKSSSGAPGDLLGLGSYASDDDDDETTKSSSLSTTRQINTAQQHTLSENIPEVAEGSSLKEETEGPSEEGQTHKKSEHKTSGSTRDSHYSGNDKINKVEHGNDIVRASTPGTFDIREDKINVDGGKPQLDKVESKDALEGKTYFKPEVKKSKVDDSQGRVSRMKADLKDEKERKRNSADKDFGQKVETTKSKADEKHPDFADTRKQDQRHAKKEKIDERNDSKERTKDRGSKYGEKSKDSDSRKKSNSKEDKKEIEKLKKSSAKEDSNRKRERSKDDKEDRSRHRTGRDSSKRKRRRSSSISSRGRNSKDSSIDKRADESSDEASEDSRKRKPRSRKHSLSPSPTRSRRRQVSRSPHSKHSQRRHSPYSSHESSRRRRSRSNSPPHRRR